MKNADPNLFEGLLPTPQWEQLRRDWPNHWLLLCFGYHAGWVMAIPINEENKKKGADLYHGAVMRLAECIRNDEHAVCVADMVIERPSIKEIKHRGYE